LHARPVRWLPARTLRWPLRLDSAVGPLTGKPQQTIFLAKHHTKSMMFY
jgi:hypothetical protein